VVTISRVRRFLSGEAHTTGLPVTTLLLGAVALHVTITILAINPWYPDKHFQILEFAWSRTKSTYPMMSARPASVPSVCFHERRGAISSDPAAEGKHSRTVTATW